MGKAVASVASTVSTRSVRVVLAGMLLTLLAAISLSVWAQPAPQPGDRSPGMEWQRGEHGMEGMHHGMDGMHERMEHGHRGMGDEGGAMMFRGSPERIGRRIDRMLDGLNASDAQRSQIKQIAAAAAADMKSEAEAGRALHQRAMQVFTAPTIDANAVEQVRQQMMQQHDRMSRRMTQAMLDVARVLTPEQRARLGERMRDRQARMEDRMKRMHERMQHMEPARR
jgi:protein CpxP